MPHFLTAATSTSPTTRHRYASPTVKVSLNVMSLWRWWWQDRMSLSYTNVLYTTCFIVRWCFALCFSRESGCMLSCGSNEWVYKNVTRFWPFRVGKVMVQLAKVFFILYESIIIDRHMDFNWVNIGNWMNELFIFVCFTGNSKTTKSLN